MPRPTEWRKLLSNKRRYERKSDWEGFSCYELGLKTLKGKTKDIVAVYVGHTINENDRIWRYSYYKGSHLEKHISNSLRKGLIIYYRGRVKNTKHQAKKMEKKLLKERYYAWNTQIN